MGGPVTFLTPVNCDPSAQKMIPLGSPKRQHRIISDSRSGSIWRPGTARDQPPSALCRQSIRVSARNGFLSKQNVPVAVASAFSPGLPSSGADAITHCRRADWVDARRNCWRAAMQIESSVPSTVPPLRSGSSNAWKELRQPALRAGIRTDRCDPAPLIHRRAGDRLSPRQAEAPLGLSVQVHCIWHSYSSRFINTGSPTRRALSCGRGLPLRRSRRQVIAKLVKEPYAHGERLMIRRVPDYSASAADEEFPVTRCGSGARAHRVTGNRSRSCAPPSPASFSRIARCNRSRWELRSRPVAPPPPPPPRLHHTMSGQPTNILQR
jgi:hypothetical protein